ncbi:MAG: prepilin-type N-terminal cleavage/methylation domain-containing protein [Parcubacteria group bacterium]|nr:prepilin-type N-terminal cleavage/methylation domain-containing protein [Parcubacteria group bacterium]
MWRFDKNFCYKKKTSFVNGAGFTLVEVIVSMSIFSFLIVTVTGIMIRSLGAQNKTLNVARLQADAQNVFGRFIDDIKTHTIDYAYSGYSGGLTLPASELALVDDEGSTVVYRSGDSVCPDLSSSPCLEVSYDQGVSWNAATSRGVRLPSLRFFIMPQQNPFERSGGAYASNRQPEVTITAAFQTAKGDHTLFLQNTISSRVYER